MNQIDKRIEELGLKLPKPVAPVANYVPYVQTGHQLFISGQVSVTADGELIKGRLGEDLDVARGQAAARACALNLIAQMKAACAGDLTRVRRIVKVGGFVNALPTATDLDIPKIINGCSDLLVEVFGEVGKHARFAVAAPALPLDVAVEIDCVVELTA
ncbi:MAG TPA: RidA family protein [Hellea balneolensis]|uniref:RidA family protein n=1 Tax=Hellea balneolensis TaxID=287478 RepID=A0A7V5NWT9_9PROT|nr:RidA family protein [Hellea balneolensis]